MKSKLLTQANTLLKTHIRNLRKKIGQKHMKTTRGKGKGYLLEDRKQE